MNKGLTFIIGRRYGKTITSYNVVRQYYKSTYGISLPTIEDIYLDSCPFCKEPCNRPWCPYTKEEK